MGVADIPLLGQIKGRLGWLDARQRVIAENVAAGPARLDQAMAMWMRSPPHLANIANAQVRHVGIGRAVGADGRTTYWTAVYAAPR